MKQYACKFCNVWTSRPEARKCIKKHVKDNFSKFMLVRDYQ